MTERETDTPEDPGVRPEVGSVLDASAVLALLLGERGAETVADAIAEGAAMSTVNYAEVATILIREGRGQSPLEQVALQVRVEEFTVADATTAAALTAGGERLGLSLGDRACLALSERLHAPALTADSAWAQLDVGIAITLIRHGEP